MMQRILIFFMLEIIWYKTLQEHHVERTEGKTSVERLDDYIKYYKYIIVLVERTFSNYYPFLS